MSDEMDGNKIFVEQMAARNVERAEKLGKAKTAAWFTRKERFKVRKFKKLYVRLNPDDVDEFTPWETLIRESEYDYYVVQKEMKSLKEYVKHLVRLDGFG
jgi:hypothetical protein